MAHPGLFPDTRRHAVDAIEILEFRLKLLKTRVRKVGIGSKSVLRIRARGHYDFIDGAQCIDCDGTYREANGIPDSEGGSHD